MLQNSTFAFLENLKENNSSEWFKDNDDAYKNAREDVVSFVGELIEGLSIMDKSIRQQYLEPKKCIKRINRDIRFSLNKQPYKTNFFVLFNPGGYKSEAASYFIQIEPNQSFVGGGVYMPPIAELNKFRKEIEYDLKKWENIINKISFTKMFPHGVESSSVLKTVPRGFDKDSDAIKYLQMKGYYTIHPLSNKQLTSPNAVSMVLETFKELNPMLQFLNNALH
ncbi:MAG: DUF2461 domain-containing protein [Candidatus Saccharimonadaceae bacterium]